MNFVFFHFDLALLKFVKSKSAFNEFYLSLWSQSNLWQEIGEEETEEGRRDWKKNEKKKREDFRFRSEVVKKRLRKKNTNF